MHGCELPPVSPRQVLPGQQLGTNLLSCRQTVRKQRGFGFNCSSDSRLEGLDSAAGLVTLFVGALSQVAANYVRMYIHTHSQFFACVVLHSGCCWLHMRWCSAHEASSFGSLIVVLVCLLGGVVC